MPYPKLSDKPIRIVGESEAKWKSIRCSSWPGCARNYDDSPTRNKYTRQVIDLSISISGIEMAGILRVQVTTIGRPKAPPTCREELDTSQPFHRVVVECIWSPAVHIHRRSDFPDYLYVLVKQEIKTQPRQQLIRSIQKHRVAHRRALRIAIYDVAHVCCQVYMLTEPCTDKSNHAKVAPIRPWTSPTLHLIKARKPVRFVWIPTVERNNANP